MPHIFISHSSADNDFARTLAGQLENAGFDVWVDFDAIGPGDRWVQTIQKAIEDCGAAVVVMSRAGRDSEWVERETLLAMDLRKPIHTALIDDIPLPLHLINRQYTDFRADQSQASARLIKALRELDRSAAPRKAPRRLSPLPNSDNFFNYIARRPGGKQNALIAKDLYRWGKKHADSVEFGGRITPGFHVRVQVGESDLTVFSVWAYPHRPAAQVQFFYLMDYPPYDDPQLRRSTLHSLAKLLEDTPLDDKADRRPTFPFSEALETAEKLEAFKQVMEEIIDNLRSV